MNTSLLERYRPYLPISDATPIITLGEGDTPLVRSRLLADRLGCEELYFKLEGCNPSGSFKDRGMVVAVAKALEEGATGLICASTGNTSASAAAYGARTGLPTTVVVPKEHVARGKLGQAVAYGAKVVLIDGNFDDALSLVRSLAERNPLVLVNSVNPHRIQGQKTAAFELVEALEGAPDHVFLPVGNAGNIIAYWQGFYRSTRPWVGHLAPQDDGLSSGGRGTHREERARSRPRLYRLRYSRWQARRLGGSGQGPGGVRGRHRLRDRRRDHGRLQAPCAR